MFGMRAAVPRDDDGHRDEPGIAPVAGAVAEAAGYRPPNPAGAGVSTACGCATETERTVDNVPADV
ncbi:hypothetical protein D3C71_1869390 [compost metagenome]